MDWEFDSEEERELRKSVAACMQGQITLLKESHERNIFPRSLFQTLAQLGLAGLTIPEEHGGYSSPAWTSALVYEEIAFVDLGPAIFLSVHNMVGKIISKHANVEQQSKYLPDLASGKALGAFVLSETQAGSDAAALQLRAEDKDSHFILNGEKAWITSAGEADLYLVFARTGSKESKDSISAFLVPKDIPGLSIGKAEKKMGCELSPIASLFFENMHLPKENLLGPEGKGLSVALEGLEAGRVNIAAAANGIMQAALSTALGHLQQRKQFGKNLIEFQGLQFMLADMQMALDASRLMTWRAAVAISAGRNAKQLASAAKCLATDFCMKVTTDAVQLCGALGYMQEFGLERRMRDAKMLQIVEGANQIQRMIIAKEMIKTSS